MGEQVVVFCFVVLDCDSLIFEVDGDLIDLGVFDQGFFDEDFAGWAVGAGYVKGVNLHVRVF